ncbi:hypothetical protein [Komagataeibacter europaeus]|uniref:hypothetical protein n=1 Tax=Komagataeibacter europaeus TaxID=33995 RepID=UPI000A6A8908|nr:hypothetical protein [Komagataeibacter europaeus]
MKLFSKSFEERHLFEKGGTQKLLLFFINHLFSNSLLEKDGVLSKRFEKSFTRKLPYDQQAVSSSP